RQLDVSTATTTAPTETTASAAPPTETAAPPPAETAAPAPADTAPAESGPAGGVYTAVPLGGTQPVEIDRVIPRYPLAARRAQGEGSVVGRGIGRRDGTNDDVEVIKALAYGLGEAARQAVSQWKFRPATYRGEPIDVYYTVTVNFRLH